MSSRSHPLIYPRCPMTFVCFGNGSSSKGHGATVKALSCQKAHTCNVLKERAFSRHVWEERAILCILTCPSRCIMLKQIETVALRHRHMWPIKVLVSSKPIVESHSRSLKHGINTGLSREGGEVCGEPSSRANTCEREITRRCARFGSRRGGGGAAAKKTTVRIDRQLTNDASTIKAMSTRAMYLAGDDSLIF